MNSKDAIKEDGMKKYLIISFWIIVIIFDLFKLDFFSRKVLMDRKTESEVYDKRDIVESIIPEEALNNQNELLAKEENYQITYSVIDQEKYRYHYRIYNQNGMVVREEQSDREPIISYIDDNMIEILISTGTYTFFCTYYDISEDRFSEVYQTPIIAEYGKVVYFEIREKVFQIIVRDIFDKNAFYKEFEIPNVSFVAMPIKEAIFLNEDTLQIKYLSGELYKEEEIILDLE